MAIDELFVLNKVLKTAKNSGNKKALIQCVVKNNKKVFDWEKAENFIIESATIMRDFADGEARMMVVVWMDDLENAKPESLLKQINSQIDGLLYLYKDRYEKRF